MRLRRMAPAGGVFAFAAAAMAQPSPVTFPVKPVRLVVGFVPGGGADTAARLAAQKLFESWGQQVVVDNRPGAGGNTAAEIVSRSAPDGYTLLLSSPGPVAINVAMQAKLAFDPRKDLAPITQVAFGPNVLVVPVSLRATNVKELIALAAATPSRLSYGSSGMGSTPFLSAELFKMMAKVDMLGVTYKGAAPAVVDLVAGRLDVLMVSIPSILAQVRAQRLRALAVTSLKRSPLLPDLPTMHEAGLAGYEAGVWWGMLAPADTPPALVNRINVSVVRGLRAPEVVSRLATEGVDIAATTPAEFGAFLRDEISKWSRVVKAAGIKAE